jgi:hypothetical protein
MKGLFGGHHALVQFAQVLDAVTEEGLLSGYAHAYETQAIFGVQ